MPTHSEDVRWRVGDVEVDGVLSGQPTWSVGDTVSLECYVGEETIAGTPTTQHHYEATYGGALAATFGGQRPARAGTQHYATLTGEWRHRDDVYLDDSESPYGKLRDMTTYSGNVTIQTSVDGIPVFREHIPQRADFETYVRPIVPVGDDVEWADGAWVIVTDATDLSVIPAVDAWLAVELECYVLAPIDQYGTLEELEADMKPPVVP